jgi:DNA polymerase delta subunit 1
MDTDENFEHEQLLGEGPENQNTCKKWARPVLPYFDPEIDTIEFQQIEIDHYISQPLFGMPGAQASSFTIAYSL